MKDIIDQARLDSGEKYGALRRLDSYLKQNSPSSSESAVNGGGQGS